MHREKGREILQTSSGHLCWDVLLMRFPCSLSLNTGPCIQTRTHMQLISLGLSLPGPRLGVNLCLGSNIQGEV